MKQPAEALAATIAFFKENPTQRTRYTLARTRDGKDCAPLDPNAVCWCAIGRYAYERGEDTDPYALAETELHWATERVNDADLSADGHLIIAHLERMQATDGLR